MNDRALQHQNVSLVENDHQAQDTDTTSPSQDAEPPFQNVGDPHSQDGDLTISQDLDDHQSQYENIPSINNADSEDISYIKTVEVNNSNCNTFQPPLSKIRKKWLKKLVSNL